MAEIKFTEEESTELRELQQKFNGITVQFGQLKIRKLEIEKIEAKLVEDLDKSNVESQSIATKLSEKYGAGTFNPETGIFTPDEVQTPSQVETKQ